MKYDLISEEEYESLPEDNELCFVAFEAIWRRNLNKLIDEHTTKNFDAALYGQYMTAVSAVANECGIPNINAPNFSYDDSYEQFTAFSMAVQGEVARIRIRGRRNQQTSVQLLDNTRTKIEHYVSRLRETINASDLDDGKKKKLHERLNQLTEELGKRRLDLGKAMHILSFVLIGLPGVVTVAADAPNAITNIMGIMRLIGLDKESEEKAMLRLAPPPKALPAPVAKPAKRPSIADELDDDIPF